MANTKATQERKKVNNLSSSNNGQQKDNKTNSGDLSQKQSSNVGKGPKGENL